MTAAPERSRGTAHLADGVVRVFAAEMLLLPTGLVTAAVLTRTLGPDGYGLFSLAAAFAGWLSLTSSGLLTRAAVKFLSEAHDWRPVATSVLRYRIALGGSVAIIVAVGALPIARLLGAAEIAPFLRVLALDIFVQNIARAYRDVLTGTGRFREVALVTTIRWLSRMILVMALLLTIGTIMSAVMATLGATFVMLLGFHIAQPLSLRGPSGITGRQMWNIAGPLAVYAMAIQLFSIIDLFALSALGWPAVDVGHYSAATNLSVAPGLFALALAPLLLAAMGHAARDGRPGDAEHMGAAALRAAFCLIPFAGIVAGASGEIVRAIFGAAFAPAGPILTLLFAAAVCLTINAVAVSMLVAADRTGIVAAIGVGSLVLAVAGHLALIPSRGAPGAALVTLSVALLGAVVALALVRRYWTVSTTLTLMRAIFLSIPMYLAAELIDAGSTWGLVAKLALLSLTLMFAFVVFGDIDRRDIAAVWRGG